MSGIGSTTTIEAQLEAAAQALSDNRLATSESLVRDVLKRSPENTVALYLLAELAIRARRYSDAQKFLEHCLQRAPQFAQARHAYARVLIRQNSAAEALAQADALIVHEPHNPNNRNVKAAALARIGDTAAAIAWYEDLLREFPEQPKLWLSYGHALKAEGRTDEAIAAYRRGIAAGPQRGEAYWSLADIKTFRFEANEIEAIRACLADVKISREDRIQFDFAMGKALEDAGAYAESFAHYKSANLLRRPSVPYDPVKTSEHVRRSKAHFFPEFFRARAGGGSATPDPVFIVGMPRSGSTLVEQILASHSAVEGTAELPEIAAIAVRLGDRKRLADPSVYPESLATVAPQLIGNLGEEYIARTRVRRKLGKPFFTDKTPNNFAHIGLIHLILPNAKIIDVRRHPLACGFSCYKQYFAHGQGFTYDLTELGRYYADYVELMAHFDSVLPGRVHRVVYERLIDDPEAEITKLVEYCGLAFEPGCLKFHENNRPVRTASAEQVRRPIFREGLDHWRNFEPWLGPLKEALGPVLESYPDAPHF